MSVVGHLRSRPAAARRGPASHPGPLGGGGARRARPPNLKKSRAIPCSRVPPGRVPGRRRGRVTDAVALCPRGRGGPRPYRIRIPYHERWGVGTGRAEQQQASSSGRARLRPREHQYCCCGDLVARQGNLGSGTRACRRRGSRAPCRSRDSVPPGAGHSIPFHSGTSLDLLLLGTIAMEIVPYEPHRPEAQNYPAKKQFPALPSFKS